MSSPQSFVWKDALEFTVPDVKALLWDSGDLWLCYAMAHTSPLCYAIVRFIDVIDYRLSPINDEGIGKHPYAKAGLQFYAFNEITGSRETIEWSVLRARHWAVTFKDDTLDVVASDAKVVGTDLHAHGPLEALVCLLREQPNKSLQATAAAPPVL
jgi:hypothetical protein